MYDDFKSEYMAARKPHADVREYLRLIGLPTKAARVLDIGSGFLRETAYLSGSVEMLVGLDISMPMLRSAIHNGPADLVVADFDQGLPFLDSSFSHAIAISSLHHSADQYKFMSEIGRVVGDSGSAFFLTHTPEQVEQRVTYRFFPGLATRASARFIAPSKIRRTLERHGFRVRIEILRRSTALIDKQLLQRIGQRAFDSAFFMITDKEWMDGFSALQSAVLAGEQLEYSRDRLVILASK